MLKIDYVQLRNIKFTTKIKYFKGNMLQNTASLHQPF